LQRIPVPVVSEIIEIHLLHSYCLAVLPSLSLSHHLCLCTSFASSCEQSDYLFYSIVLVYPASITQQEPWPWTTASAVPTATAQLGLVPMRMASVVPTVTAPQELAPTRMASAGPTVTAPLELAQMNRARV